MAHDLKGTIFVGAMNSSEYSGKSLTQSGHPTQTNGLAGPKEQQRTKSPNALDEVVIFTGPARVQDPTNKGK